MRRHSGVFIANYSLISLIADVSIVYFELVNGDWELCSSYYPHKMRKSNMKFPFLIEQTQSSRRVLEKRCS